MNQPRKPRIGYPAPPSNSEIKDLRYPSFTNTSRDGGTPSSSSYSLHEGCEKRASMLPQKYGSTTPSTKSTLSRTPYNISVPNIQSIPEEKHYSAESGFVNCCVVRDGENSPSILQQRYNFFFQSSESEYFDRDNTDSYSHEHDTFAMVAEKQPGNLTSNYHMFDISRISRNTGQDGRSYLSPSIQYSKKDGNYIGKVRKMKNGRSNYSLYDSKQKKEQIAAFMYDVPSMWEQWAGPEGQVPRRLKAILPSVGTDGKIEPKPLHSFNRLIEQAKKNKPNLNSFMTFHSKEPYFDCGEYKLNFKGRVTTPSVKNMQLVDDHNEIIIQFGKVGDDRFHLDYKAPFNAFQAFALALTVMDM